MLLKLQSYFFWAISSPNWRVLALWVSSLPTIISSYFSLTPLHSSGDLQTSSSHSPSCINIPQVSIAATWPPLICSQHTWRWPLSGLALFVRSTHGADGFCRTVSDDTRTSSWTCTWLSRAQPLAGIVEIVDPWMHHISALLCTCPGQSLIPCQV